MIRAACYDVTYYWRPSPLLPPRISRPSQNAFWTVCAISFTYYLSLIAVFSFLPFFFSHQNHLTCHDMMISSMQFDINATLPNSIYVTWPNFSRSFTFIHFTNIRHDTICHNMFERWHHHQCNTNITRSSKWYKMRRLILIFELRAFIFILVIHSFVLWIGIYGIGWMGNKHSTCIMIWTKKIFIHILIHRFFRTS